MDYSNYNKNKEEILCSWPVILFALYIFFPLGIYLIIKKQSLHRRNIFTIGKKTLSTSISLFVVGFLLYLPKIITIFSTSNDSDIEEIKSVVDSKVYSVVMKFGNLFIFLGIGTLLLSLYQKGKGKKYRKYISIVVNNEVQEISKISSKLNLSKEIVLKDLKKMIEKGYLENYEVDLDETRIFNIKEEKKKREEKEKNVRVVQCPNCNASNKLTEKIGKCEYCNSYIE